MSATTGLPPRDTISAAIRQAGQGGRPAVVAFATAGFPDREGFIRNLQAIASEADVVEIGVPFSDPMADGATIQRASFAALKDGFTLPWLLRELETMQPRPKAPLLLMSYLNPLLAFGLSRLPEAAAQAGVSGFIIPDLPYEESAEMRAALAECCQAEGILPAIESAHAFAGARKYAAQHPGCRILIGLSGRGDKDMPTLQRTLLKGAT